MRRVPAQRGFTLVELLITIILAGIAFAALTPVFVQALTTTASEKARLAALNLAQDRIEKIRQLDFDQITQSSLVSMFGSEWTADQGNGKDYSVSYWVKESSNAKQVFVTADWDAAPRRVPNTFIHSPGYSEEAGHGYGVTLSTIIYSQYGGAQVIDLEMNPDTSSGLLTWENDYPLALVVQAVVNPLHDNGTTAYRAAFKAYGANDTVVLDEEVASRDPSSGRFQITWIPDIDGMADGTYRFEVTVFSAGGLPGNTYAEEFRFESGRPIAAQALEATSGNQVVTLRWLGSPSADVSSYQVWRNDGTPDGPFSQIAGVPAGNVGDGVVYVDTNVANGGSYRYYVIAVDGAGLTSNRTEIVDALPAPQEDTAAPPTPTVTATVVGRLVTLTWADVSDILVDGQVASGIEHYIVTRDDGSSTLVLSPKLPGRPISYTDTVDESHSYSVVAWDLAGNSSQPATVDVAYTPRNFELTVSATENNVTFTVRDDADAPVETIQSNRPVTWTLPEGDYSVIAVSRRGVVRGPVDVVLNQNVTLPPFVF